ncbi:hypothetical protein [Chryseobacterium sp.]|uniref:hypothetical protein n=1 Tax=Chryseobacterium sp. TaxID=1871047 RepID=UPI0012A9D113|nr:hypothetical protein [Chryseobacterium sp.]QFG53193.1 hypothetical protein F7R58_06415 [Chryseobacterium sp.]
MSKKLLILKAFEDLDADMLDVLLNDGQSYQDVHKETFVTELKSYFEDLRNNRDYKTDFKAVQGMCTNCNKGKKGYSFVNSEGESFTSMVFEESDDDYTDIYKCSSFKTFDREITEEWIGIHFYEEDKVNYRPTELHIRQQKESGRAVKALEMEIKAEGILSKNFYVPWVSTYRHLHSIGDIFTHKSYRYKNEVSRYLWILEPMAKVLEKSNLARELWQEFIAFSLIDRETVQDWLIRADYHFPNYKFGTEYQADYLQDFFVSGSIKIRLSEHFYLHNIALILHKYSDWLPDYNPLKEVEDFASSEEDDEMFPF